MRNFVAATVLCIVGPLFGGTAHAASPNYKYIDLAYGAGSLDITIIGLGTADIDQDGFELEGSVSFIDDRLWIYGSYSDLSGDEAGLKLDIETTGAGAGWIFRPTATTTIDLSLIYRKDKLSALGLSESIDGYGIAAGVRGNVSDVVELFGRIGYLESDYEGAFTADLGAVFNIGERWAISVAYERLDADDQGVEIELSQFQVGGRVKF